MLERTDDGPKEGMCLFIVSSRAPSSHRIMDFSHHTVIAESKYLYSNRIVLANIKLSSFPKHYVMVPCLQHRDSRGTFTITIKSSTKVRVILTQLPLVRTRVSMKWNQGLGGSHSQPEANPQIRLTLPAGLHLSRVQFKASGSQCGVGHWYVWESLDVVRWRGGGYRDRMEPNTCFAIDWTSW